MINRWRRVKSALAKGSTPIPSDVADRLELLEQQVRFLVADSIRLNQVLREIVFVNDLKRSYLGSQTKGSFEYQWREVPEGKWMPSNREFLDSVADQILEKTQLPRKWFPGKRVLDAGCGLGRWTYGFLKLGAEVTAVDQSPGGLERTRKLTRGMGSLELQQQDILELKVEPECFDLVWCFGVAHHTENPLKAIKNLLPPIKLGGWLFMMLYGYPQDLDSFRTQADYEEWRRRLSPMTFADKVKILRETYPPEFVHGYFDAVSPQINDLFTWEWIQAFLQNEGFEEVHRTINHNNHHFVARKKAR
jgi:SAM-dependent methyltransferase